MFIALIEKRCIKTKLKKLHIEMSENERPDSAIVCWASAADYLPLLANRNSERNVLVPVTN